MKITESIELVKEIVNRMAYELENGTHTAQEFIIQINRLALVFKDMLAILPQEIMDEYRNFFIIFIQFCKNCGNESFLIENVDNMESSLLLLGECMEEIVKKCEKKIHICPCCGEQVVYRPLSKYYQDMHSKYGGRNFLSETLNIEQYSCPNCGSSDRDRMIITFLKICGLEEANENTSVLQIAPAQSIDYWLHQFCPQLIYHTTDLNMDGVTFHSDIQNMNEVEDKKYDMIICSHVLEHVQNDDLAFSEMKRILKEDGKIVFLVPIDLNISEIDEEWGCSEEENWRRFGQGDHCRRYSKSGLKDRMQKHFFVHELGKEFFGVEAFEQCGLIATSILYVLTKSENVELSYKKEEASCDKELINLESKRADKIYRDSICRVQEQTNEIKVFVEEILRYCENTGDLLLDDGMSESIINLANMLEGINQEVPWYIYEVFEEFFCELGIFCKKCKDSSFLHNNSDNLVSSLTLLIECLDELFNMCVDDDDMKHNGPLVSVILPCYNHAHFVAAAIESVLNQTYKNIEFIVGDDCSTDDTPIIMKKYSSYYAKEIYYSENMGGRDQDLRAFATGKYIALMHSDDVWGTEKIASQVRYMEAHPECGACFTWCQYTDEELNVIPNDIFIQPNRSREEWMNFFWENGNALCNPSSLIRKELCVQTTKYGNENRQLPDFFKWIEFVQKVDIHILPIVMVYMRRYNREGMQNTSVANVKTQVKSMIESGVCWLSIIRDMEESFFVNSFRKLLVDKYVSDPVEIKCEKLFLMLNHPNVFIQHSGLTYYNEIYLEAREVLEKKYGYSGKSYRRDEEEKGLFMFLYEVLRQN